MNVLIIEDEKDLGAEVELFLKNCNYICELTLNGKQASQRIAENRYDFILLDLGLPEYEGLDLLIEAKKINPDAICIILTARGEVADRIRGLNLGADDYLAKPFSLHELQSRMQAITRRKFGLQQQVLALGPFEINLSERTISHSGQIIETITKKEYDLISYLILYKNRTLTRSQLSEHIWGSMLTIDSDSNYIDAHIKNLRRKLSAYASCDWLETVRGLGYRIRIA